MFSECLRFIQREGKVLVWDFRKIVPQRGTLQLGLNHRVQKLHLRPKYTSRRLPTKSPGSIQEYRTESSLPGHSTEPRPTPCNPARCLGFGRSELDGDAYGAKFVDQYLR